MSESIRFVPVGARGSYALHVRDCNRLWSYFHERYCVTVVQKGLARWRYRQRDADASPQGAMLMEPGEIHANTSVQDAGTFFALFVSPEHITDLSAELLPNKPHFAFSVLQAPHSLQHLHALIAACEQADPQAQEEQLCLALTQVFWHATEQRRPLPRPARTHVRRGRILLEERYREDPGSTVDVGEVARDSGVSYYWFVHSFRAEYGLPPYRFVQSLRASHARQLVAGGPTAELRSLRDIANASGYADAPHMTRDFRRTFGVTPKAMATAVHPGWR
jgi:AraC-like DNA-binding protein